MTRVITGSRLHFGMFNLHSEWDRKFGSVGMMIDKPGLSVRVERAPTWSATGPLADRALSIAKDIAAKFADKSLPLNITIETAAPDHAGLGTGTQLALAVAQALNRELNLGLTSSIELAELTGRGQRSAIGIHGFAHGGFLVDAGKSSRAAVAPLLHRQPFPDDWRVLLVIPKKQQGLFGAKEKDVFARLASSPSPSESLCRLILLGLLPALIEADLPVFGEALYEFNRKVGEMFHPAQGGVYTHPETQEIVDFLRKEGISGVGQSSWGPTVFGVADEERAAFFADRLRTRLSSENATITVAKSANSGVSV